MIILSLVIGKITQVAFFFYLYDDLIRWASIVVYLISWPMLFIGVWWMGKEYADSLRRYFSYKFYQEYVKAGTRKVYRATKEKTKKLKENMKGKIKRQRPESQT